MANQILISNFSVGMVMVDPRPNQTNSGFVATASFNVDLTQFSGVSGTISLVLDGFWGNWGTQDVNVPGTNTTVQWGAYGQPTVLNLTSQSSFPTNIWVSITGIDPYEIDRLTVTIDQSATSLQLSDLSSVVFDPGPAASVDGLNQTDVVETNDLLIPPQTPGSVTPNLPGTADGYGVDTLDLSGLGGAVQLYADVGTLVWTPDGKNSPENSRDFTASYGRYVVHSTQDGSVIYGSGETSESFVISGNGVTLSAGSYAGDGLTDTIDYSRTGDEASGDGGVVVNLGAVSGGFSTVSRGPDGTVQDRVKGVEGVIGSRGDDSISGDLKNNLFVGGAGDDQLDGRAGDDILVGGKGADTLRGGSGNDVLIDLDGGVLRGNETANATGGDGRDVYIVRSGATSIQNFHLSGPNTHLAGQQSKVNDVIAFNLALGTYTGLESFLANVNELKWVATDFDMAVASWLSDNVDVTFERVGSSADFDVVLSLDVINQYYDSIQMQDVTDTFAGELARVRLSGVGDLLGEGRELGAVDIFSVAQHYDPFPSSFDGQVLKNILYPVFADGVTEAGAGEFYLAIQSSRIGTVTTANIHGVSAGDFTLEQRFFNPGRGDERLIGGFTKDDYEFILQDFMAVPPGVGGGGPGQGNDRVFDVGGTDRIYFSDVTIDEIFVESTGAALNLFGRSVGREREHNSLSVEYTQSNWYENMPLDESVLVNSGKVDFVGHFREGGATALEEIVLGLDIFKLAETRYDVDEFGDLIDDAPVDLVALSGEDSFMVGRYDLDDPRAPNGERFVIKASQSTSSGDETNVYLWNFNENDDLIVLEGFTNTSQLSAVAPKGAKDSVWFESDQGLVSITFMDTHLSGGFAIDELSWVQAA